MKTKQIKAKPILTILLVLSIAGSFTEMKAQSFPACDECLTIDGTEWTFKNKLNIFYRDSTSYILPDNQFRTHPLEIYINGEKAFDAGNEVVSPVPEKTYQFSIDLASYVGDSLELRVREYNLNSLNGNQGGVRYETIRKLPFVPVMALDQFEAHSIFFFDKPNSCGGGTEAMTSFDGLPAEAQIKALTFEESKLFVFPKGESIGQGFVFHFANGLYDKITVSTRGDGGNGNEVELPIVDQPYFPRIEDVFLNIFKSVEVPVNFFQLYRDPEYNHCVPILMKLYKDGQLVRTTVIPVLITGGETEVTQNSPTTWGAPIPQMVLHAPVGDGSKTFMENSTEVCSEIKTFLSSESGQSGYLKLELGVEGSVFGVPFEAGASTTASLTSKQASSREILQEGCISEVQGIEISNKDDEGATYTGTKGDIFMGMATEYYYGPSFQVVHEGCKAEAQNGIGLAVKSIEPFIKREFQIEDAIDSLEEKISKLDTSNTSGLAQKRRLQNDVDAWTQMVALNRQNVANASDIVDVYTVIEGASIDFKRVAERTKTISMETKLFVESSLEGTVGAKVAGTGFEAGAGINVSNEVGNGQTQSVNYSNVTGYTLAENEAGDITRIRVKEDNYFGSYIFELVEDGSQTSCPYIGGKRRDVPALSIGPDKLSYLATEASIGDGEEDRALISLNVCNNSESNEARVYKLQVVDSKSAIVLYSDDPLTNEGVKLPEVPAGSCNEVFITVDQPQAGLTSFKDIQLRLTDLCEEYETANSKVSIDVTFVEQTTSASSIPLELRSAKLLQNYPNPAVHETTIPFYIPEAANTAELQIISLDGKLANRIPFDSKGDGQISIPTQTLSQGIWLYRLKLNGVAIDTRKMTVMKD